jgi:hypothetical protein
MTDELEIIWKEAVVAYSRYYPRIFLEGVKNYATKLSQYS